MADIYTSTGNVPDVILQSQISENVLQALQANMRLTPLVKNYDCTGLKSNVFWIPVWGTVTPATIGGTSDLTSTAFTTTKNTMTAAEIGWMTVLQDTVAEISTADDITGQIGAAAAMGFARKFDTDLGALFSTLAGSTTLGAVGSTMSVAIFLRSIYTLELANVMGNYNAVLSPLQCQSLRAAVAASAAVISPMFVAQKSRPDGFVGNIYGVDTYQVNTLTVGCATTGSIYGAMMGEDDQCPIAIGFWRKVRTEFQRDASRRGNEIVVSSRYAVTEQRDAGGVGIYAK